MKKTIFLRLGKIERGTKSKWNRKKKSQRIKEISCSEWHRLDNKINDYRNQRFSSGSISSKWPMYNGRTKQVAPFERYMRKCVQP